MIPRHRSMDPTIADRIDLLGVLQQGRRMATTAPMLIRVSTRPNVRPGGQQDISTATVPAGTHSTASSRDASNTSGLRPAGAQVRGRWPFGHRPHTIRQNGSR
jgi:hypothetical protein